MNPFHLYQDNKGLMPIYRPSELHQFLQNLGLRPKKGLSQNFLIDGNIIRKIVVSAALTPQDLVLEVGPGPGCLSEEILKQGVGLLAVEKDKAMADALHRLQTHHEKLQIYCDDILSFPIEQKLAENLQQGQKAVILGNLPYHLTTPILVKLVPLHAYASKIIIMVQEEVARRMTAKPGSSEYSSFTVFLNFYSNPHYAFTVRRTCFYPIPNVDSAVVILDLHPPAKVSNQDAFFVMTRTAFGQRRKMLRSSLKELYDSERITQALEKMGRDIKSRPEELSLAEFIQFFEIVSSLTILDED